MMDKITKNSVLMLIAGIGMWIVPIFINLGTFKDIFNYGGFALLAIDIIYIIKRMNDTGANWIMDPLMPVAFRFMNSGNIMIRPMLGSGGGILKVYTNQGKKLVYIETGRTGAKHMVAGKECRIVHDSLISPLHARNSEWLRRIEKEFKAKDFFQIIYIATKIYNHCKENKVEIEKLTIAEQKEIFKNLLSSGKADLKESRTFAEKGIKEGEIPEGILKLSVAGEEIDFHSILQFMTSTANPLLLEPIIEAAFKAGQMETTQAIGMKSSEQKRADWGKLLLYGAIGLGAAYLIFGTDFLGI